MSVPNEFDQTPIASSESPPLSIDGRPIKETPRRDFSGYLDSQVPHQSPGLPHRRPPTETLTHEPRCPTKIVPSSSLPLTTTSRRDLVGLLDAPDPPRGPFGAGRRDGRGTAFSRSRSECYFRLREMNLYLNLKPHFLRNFSSLYPYVNFYNHYTHMLTSYTQKRHILVYQLSIPITSKYL